MQKKHMKFPLTLSGIAENGEFVGYASIFDVVDNQRDIIRKGAFTRSIKERGGEIKLLWQHRQDEPIGVFTEIKEDGKGLFVSGKLLLEVERAREAYVLLKSGSINGLSIGYTVKKSRMDHQRKARVIEEVDLWEISLVTFPANEMARVAQVKSVSQDDLEQEFNEAVKRATEILYRMMKGG